MRVLLFIVTNLLVVATISIVFSLLGIQPYLSAQGINYTSLAIFCALWGTIGAFVSLFFSKTFAKRGLNLKIIDPQSASGDEKQLLDIVYGLAHKAGLSKQPEVGIYQSPEVNAFATGPSRNDSLVAVSTGLLQNMSRDEVEAVLGHEISHVANGDMVTMTLIQGIINAFALFLSRIVAYVVSMAIARDEEEGGMSYLVYFALTFVFDIIFTLLGSIAVAAFSRWREFRADAGGARLTSRDKMIAALQRLQSTVGVEDKRAPSMAALKISHQSGWFALFASHPPLPVRIQRLQQATN